MKRRFLINMITCIIGLLTVVAGILESVTSTQIPQAVTPYLRFAWPILLVVALAFIGFTLWGNRLLAENDKSTLPPNDRDHLPPPLLPKIQNRQQLLERVYTYWITDKLEPSLDGILPLSLGLKKRPDAVENPFKSDPTKSKQPGRSIIPSDIKGIYEKAEKQLLILGEPGSGKTTLLLQLAEKLLDHARQEETAPIPVVLQLSAWSEKKQPLIDWILEEMETRYYVPSHLSRSWIKDGQIALLLDGLDEVTKQHRGACIDAINAYGQEQHGASLVVSSRSAEYWGEQKRLRLIQAVEVQSVDEEQQFDEYLLRNNEKLATVRRMLYEDPELRKMVTTPLVLTVLRRACGGKSVEDLLADPRETRRHQVAMTYFQYMFEHRKTARPCTQEETRSWLAWLAEQMALHHLATFSIERMQPEWLPKNWLRRLYLGLNWGLVLGLAMGGLIGLIVALIDGLISGWGNGIVTGMIVLWIIELVIGLLIGPIFGLVALPHVDWNRWLQPLANLLEEFGTDRDISLWRAAPVGGAVIGLGAVTLLMWVALVMIFWLLLYPFWLLITTLLFGQISILSKILHLVLISMMLLFMAFLIRCCRKGVKQIRRLLSENEELVDRWFKNPASALLCLFLSFAGCLPPNWPQFLNYAVEYALLRRVQPRSHSEEQSDYTFVHQFLLEHFAGLNAAAASFQKGRDLVKLDRYEEALQAFDQALPFSSDDPDDHWWKGVALHALQRHKEALRAFDQALSLNSDDSDNHYIHRWRGHSLYALQHYQEALQAFDQAIDLNPNDSDNYYWKGVALLDLQHYQEALQAFDQAIDLNPDNSYAYIGKGDVLLESNPPQYDKAREAYTQALRLDPRLAFTYRTRGMRYLDLERSEEAKRDFEEAQKLLDGESELQDPEKTQKLTDKK